MCTAGHRLPQMRDLAASEAESGVSAGRACGGAAGASPQLWLQQGLPEAEERRHC